MVSKRADLVNTSGIRRVFDLAATRPNLVDLSIGQPDFPVAESVIEGAMAAIGSGKNGYSVTQGILPLRELIKEDWGVRSDEDIDVIVTSGVSGGLFLSYLALLDPGDEILVPDPYFCAYRDLAFMASAVPVTYDCYPDFKLPVDHLETLVTKRTKAILIGSPANPTSQVLTSAEIEAVCRLADRHGLWLIADEIYRDFCYDGPYSSALRRYERTIVLGGFSKSHAVTGWRLGYALAPKQILSTLQKLQQYTFVCAPTPLQWGLLGSRTFAPTEVIENYKAKRDLFCALLAEDFSFAKPQGAFYLFIEAPGGSGNVFVERAIENGLLVVPGTAFSAKDSHFRVSFAASEERIRAGADILCQTKRAAKG